MTDQEKLAKLIGEKGYEQVEVLCRECDFDPPGWEICRHRRKNTCPTKQGGPKPPTELIEIAEKRLFVDCIMQAIKQCDDGRFWVCWMPYRTSDVEAYADTVQEASVACAIKALEMLKVANT